MKLIYSALLLLITLSVFPTPNITYTTLDKTTQNILIELPLESDDLLYHDYCTVAVDHPYCTTSDIHITNKSYKEFDPVFNAHKKVSQGPTSISVQLHADNFETINDASLLVSYYTKNAGKIIQETIPLTFENTVDPITTSIDTEQNLHAVESCVIEQKKDQKSWTWSEYISGLLKATESPFLRFILVFLIGILMSLTPCIYPMIPITVGILQAQGSKSIGRNFLLSLSYTLGLATTFAILGLLAAFAGQAMGSIMSKPFFIIPVVILLAYLAGAMLDLYPMYTPRFMQGSNQVRGGSFLTVYLCGAASGTIASPCLSPGLILLLCVVTTLGSKILGFLLLFSFGIGLGVPLLIIGTFSSSLSVLPQAGMWMVEIKKIFGLLLIGTCWYFLSNILPWHIVMIIITLSTFILGLIFIYGTKKMPTGLLRALNTLIGMALIAFSVFLAAKSYQAISQSRACSKTESIWITDYTCAREKALKTHFLLFVDIGAPFCSICKAIDAGLFQNDAVITALAKVVATKLDGSADENASIMKHYDVIGFPTILLINPKDETVIKKWGPELYGTDPQAFIDELEAAIAAF